MNPSPSPFRSSEGAAAYLAAYEASMKLWPVTYEDLFTPSRFGATHVVACGPKDAPPLVLLHAFMLSLTVWSRNIADLSKDYRVYAVDVMGQPSKSVPEQPIRSRADYIEWLTTILDALKIDRTNLAGYSYGGWLTLNYAIGSPERVDRIVVLSPAGSFLRNVTQFTLRGMPMAFFPRRFLVNAFMRWLTFKENLQDGDVRELSDRLVDQMYLGFKHFRMQVETLQVGPIPFSDDELRAIQAPTLLLIGQQEVLYNPAAALDRGRRLIRNFQGELVSRARHDMTYSQHQVVDARVLKFLKETPTSVGSTSTSHTAAA
jgi:pimeloyl-ACP methyl ester carboxylesterase